ncbi:phage holin [Paenactinomyces guangxiensis]|uniref:Holin n=1 Tax=Paenactinomyces guangxiensis TaxID=1490290 RepID=A0A7W2A7C9_9BACL|nr:phage holin [Paenactinomyces guangxiensis]MBA4493415.1 holin [Paenactinomyces guangxiensis]MBH8590506.1 holin [Paenactinomyces guangxiensis]
MSRFRNYGFWLSTAAFAMMLLKAFGMDIGNAEYNEWVNSILGLLVMLGIINNPTTKNKGYLDD